MINRLPDKLQALFPYDQTLADYLIWECLHLFLVLQVGKTGHLPQLSGVPVDFAYPERPGMQRPEMCAHFVGLYHWLLAFVVAFQRLHLQPVVLVHLFSPLVQVLKYSQRQARLRPFSNVPVRLRSDFLQAAETG